MAKKTKVVCPVCGAEIAIAEHQHVTIGVVIGKDSGLGTVELPLENEQPKKKTKAQLRIDAMKAAGMDVSRFFCTKDGKGEETVVAKSNPDGSCSIIEDNDPVVKRIVDAGGILNAHLFKQHVLAQVLKMMVSYRRDNTGHYVLSRDYKGRIDLSDYTHRMNLMGYGYSWQVLRDELKRQEAMERHGDIKCLAEDQRWYNKALVLAMFDHHHNLLTELTKKMRVRHHQGVEYIAMQGVDGLVVRKQSAPGYIYCYEIETMLKNHAGFRKSLEKAKTAKELYHALFLYMDAARPGKLSYHASEIKGLNDRVEIAACEEWKNAYKGYGGYFSMQNLILFHGLRITVPRIVGKSVENVKLSKDDSLKQLGEWADEHLNEGYWLIGALKQLIYDNGFNVERKRHEWYEKKNK